MDHFKPYAVSVSRACQLLGDKAVSSLYMAIARGQLVAIKDGRKTLVTTESIERYLKALPRGVSVTDEALGKALATHTRARVLRARRRKPLPPHRSPKTRSGGPSLTSDSV